MDYKKLYLKCFNIITDEINMHKIRIKELEESQQYIEEEILNDCDRVLLEDDAL